MNARLTFTISLVAAVLTVACDSPDRVLQPPPTQGALDAQLRQQFGFWGVVPIGATPEQSPALVDLGRSLFFDKILSGNRDVACATCHSPLTQASDGLSLAIGTGGSGEGPSRALGAGRQFVPRNAPTLLNDGIGHFYLLWDGRVNEEGSFGGGPFGGGGGGSGGAFNGPNGIVFPSGLTNLIAAQAMLPVLNRVEMRGNSGDLDRFGNQNELAQIKDSAYSDVWKAVMQRILAVQEYAAKFAAAYPGAPASAFGFQHAANAIAAFQIQELTRTNSAFDRYLARDDHALTEEQKRGALLFFTKARCSTCHSGALLGGQQFANIGVPQIGPGVGAAAPRDIGRGEQIQNTPFYQFAFRVAPLRNVELTGPYMHNGAYPTLEAVVRHYTNADSAQRNYDVTQLDPSLRGMHHGDAATINAVLSSLDQRLRPNIQLNETERAELVAFLKSLTDPAARNLSALIPVAVPSGLPVRE